MTIRDSLPWSDREHYSDGKHDGHIIVDAYGNGVVQIWHDMRLPRQAALDEVDAKVAFILRVANCHETLMAALGYARDLIGDMQQRGCPAGPVAIPSMINDALRLPPYDDCMAIQRAIAAATDNQKGATK